MRLKLADKIKRRFFDKEEIKTLQRIAITKGLSSYEELINTKFLHKSSDISKQDKSPLRNIFKTNLGRIMNGNSLKWMMREKNKNSVDLIMTSPPFGLIKKKSYGNESSVNYCKWFRDYAIGFCNVLKTTGSLVIDIQGAWQKGTPTRSLYHFDLLKMLCDEFGFYLCQEHYWWNPSKLPTPAQWVTIKRVRVKDSVNCIWWLSKTPNPKADNKKILIPYSESMQKLFKNGYYKGTRPSGHKISDKFGINHGGAIPPNIMTVSNSISSSNYLNYCKNNNLKIHPARFPSQIPEYFIKFLTNENDLVFDPFGGSSTTGYVAENLYRKWISIEKDPIFAEGGKGHFKKNK